MKSTKERKIAINRTVEQIREIEAEKGLNRESLDEIKLVLICLASQSELFSAEDFPPPERQSKRNSCLYRVSEDEDHRYTLYVNSALGTYDTPAHDHTTWAVIVGIQGEELNKTYHHSETGGIEQNEEFVVTNGSGIAFLPDDLHSIHIQAEQQPLLNFHMYGLALEQLHERKYYVPKDNTWHVFPAHTDIREARL